MKIIKGKDKIALVCSFEEVFMIRSALGMTTKHERDSRTADKYPRSYKKHRETMESTVNTFTSISKLCHDIENEHY